MGSILVTGANGYIGRNLCSHLTQEGRDVVGLSLESDPTYPHPRLCYVKLDITDREGVEWIFRKHDIDAVIHLAAMVHVRSESLTFAEYCRLNYFASESLFRTAARAGVSRIVFASTIEVYGPVFHCAPVREDNACRPDSDYARSKLLAEQALMSLANDEGLQVAIMRLAPVYGPAFRLNVDRRIYLRRPILAYVVGRGEYSINFCAMSNISRFVVRWLSGGARSSGVFNIADDEPITIRELLLGEREGGRARITLRLPYGLCLAGAAMADGLRAASGRDAGALSVRNIRKLVGGARWDNAAATAVAGPMPIDRDCLGYSR